MTNQKIHIDEIDWLIFVYKTSGDEELESESLKELLSYGFDEIQINERYKKIESDGDGLKIFEKAWEKQKQRNQLGTYTLAEKIKIFFFGPYQLFKFFDSGLTELKTGNYKVKYSQRLILIISGTIFWILFCVAAFQYSEYKRMQEIEKVDITNWENNRIKNE